MRLRNGEISKTDAVREVLKACGRPMKIDEIQPAIEERLEQIFNRGKLYRLLAGMVSAKELETVGRGDDNRFYWFKRAPK